MASKLNSHEKELYFRTHKQNKIVKTLFILFHLLLALDFGYIKRPKSRFKRMIPFFTLIYSTVFSLLSALFYFVFVEELFLKIWLELVVLHAFLNSLILTLYGIDASFFKLLESLSSIDYKLYLKSTSEKFDKKIIIVCLTCVSGKVMGNFLFCIKHNNECMDSVIGLLVHIFQELSYDISMIISSFMFYSVYLRLCVLKSFVKNGGQHVIEYLKIYKKMADTLERARRPFDLLFTFALIFKMPDLVIVTFLSLLKLKINYEYDEAHNHVIRNFYTIESYIVLISPAVAAGFVTAAAADLRTIIHERLLLERDESHAADLELFLGYLEGRPMEFTVYRVVPLDWSLPVLILNICISYQIIVVQITNLY